MLSGIFSDDTPEPVAASGDAGVSDEGSRSDHAHGAGTVAANANAFVGATFDQNSKTWTFTRASGLDDLVCDVDADCPAPVTAKLYVGTRVNSEDEIFVESDFLDPRGYSHSGESPLVMTASEAVRTALADSFHAMAFALPDSVRPTNINLFEQDVCPNASFVDCTSGVDITIEGEAYEYYLVLGGGVSSFAEVTISWTEK